MSALATIVGGLGELSESELRQLYLMVGVRLGIPDVPAGAKPQRQAGGKTAYANPSRPNKAVKGSSSKGNPTRKSQWANHPLYQEYSRLKKVVEAQAKEAKCSFNSVRTAESSAYQTAFTQWVNAKSSFRGHGGGDQARAKPGKEESDVESSEDEGEKGKAQPAAKPAKPSPTPVRAEAKPQQSKPSPGNGGQSSGSPLKGKAAHK